MHISADMMKDSKQQQRLKLVYKVVWPVLSATCKQAECLKYIWEANVAPGEAERYICLETMPVCNISRSAWA